MDPDVSREREAARGSDDPRTPRPLPAVRPVETLGQRSDGTGTPPVPVSIEAWTAEREAYLRATYCAGAPTSIANEFIFHCKNRRLSPEAGQILCVKRGGVYRNQVTLEGLRAIASRTGAFAGSDPPVWKGGGRLANGKPFADSATVTIYRLVQGQRMPFTATVFWDEFNAGANNWLTMPRHMLAKVARTHALRDAFPEELSNLWIEEELEQAGPVETYERTSSGSVVETTLREVETAGLTGQRADAQRAEGAPAGPRNGPHAGARPAARATTRAEGAPAGPRTAQTDPGWDDLKAWASTLGYKKMSEVESNIGRPVAGLSPSEVQGLLIAGGEDPSPVRELDAEADGDRRLARDALFAWMRSFLRSPHGEQLTGSLGPLSDHDGIKRLQRALFAQEPERAAGSLADRELWPTGRLRAFRLRLAAMDPNEVANLLTAGQAVASGVPHPDPAGAGTRPDEDEGPLDEGDSVIVVDADEEGWAADVIDVEAGAESSTFEPLLDPETGEVLPSDDERGAILLSWRKAARVAGEDGAAWAALLADPGFAHEDSTLWGVLAAEAPNAQVVGLLRSACRKGKGNTPAVEKLFNQRAAEIRKEGLRPDKAATVRA
jgi:phage recombination protein Bet